jgi:hypothetical protein
MPPASSAILEELLASLKASTAKDGTLDLDEATLHGTKAASLLQLFCQQFHVTSFTMLGTKLPASADGGQFTISGHDETVGLDVTFGDNLGEVAVEALFHAHDTAALRKRFPALPPDFFNAITVASGTASVTIPGVKSPLAFASPRYGIIGLATPSSGLLTTTIAPRVDGQVAAPSGSKGLLAEIQTQVTGYRIAPLDSPWTFIDLAWLTPGLAFLDAFPAIIGTRGLGLRVFDLSLYTQAPQWSSVSLAVADIADPAKPLWTAAGGKVKLTDVIVTLDLDYDDNGALVLPGTGSVQGNFMLGSLALTAEIPSPPTGVWSLTAFPNVGLSVLDDIASLLDGGSTKLSSLLPANLDKIGGFEFTYVRIAVNAGAFALQEFTFALESTKTWALIPGVIELTALRMSLTIDGTPAVYGTVTGVFGLIEGAKILVMVGRNGPLADWRLDVISPAVPLPSLGQLAQVARGVDLGSMVRAGGLHDLHFVMTNLNFGMTLAPSKLTNLGLTLQLANAADPLSPELDWNIIPGLLTLTRFSFGFQLNWGTTDTKDVFGSFVLNGLEFAVRFASKSSKGGNADGLLGEYFAQGASGTVNVKDLINSIAPTVAAGIPDGLTINLADAILAYLNTDGRQKFLFAMDIAIEMPISDLPLIGKALPSDALVGIKNLKLVVASAPLSADDVMFINSMSPKPVLTLPAPGTTGPAIPEGFSMSAQLELGAVSILVTSPPAPKQQSQAIAGGAVTGRAALPAVPASDSVMWIQVQKTFGPVQVQKIGFEYRNGAVFVVANLALTTGGLEIDLIGIGAGSPIKDPHLEFTIQGLAVSFSEGPVSILGGMIGKLDPLDFTGVLSVRTPELSLSAFAGYAQYQDHPSFFLYGVLNAPIGGPPPFFVTGIAAGVGFNRKLLIPDVSGVAAFPLVQWAQGIGAPVMDPSKPLGGQVADVLARLAQSGVVAPSVGDYWLAAGLSFTSFELIQTFALLTVSLGTDVEVALLGLSTLTIPPVDPKSAAVDPEPIAEVQLALEVAFSTGKGLLAIAGQLTNNSFVLSRKARLTGGFAFYLWFSGEHAGETVLTLGGYNPNFTVPGYYPVVPRVGLNWQVVPHLSITGELYFALTSNVIMAGGKLSAVWNSGPVAAWFTYWADFLLTFSPFHYYIDGGIDLGARFTVDLLFFSVSVTIHIGVAIELWGPAFAGKATVDLSIISFTIEFGDQSHDKDKATSIPWDQFVRKLLPGETAKQPPRALRGGLAPRADPPDQPAVVQINVTSGLARTLDPTADGPVYLVTAETFQCAVLTVIPNKDVVYDPDPDPRLPGFVNLAYAPDSEQPHNADGQLIVPATDFGAGPAGVRPGDFTPVLSLSLASAEESVLHAYRQFSGAPKALWENKTFDTGGHGVPQVNPSTVMTESTIPDTLTGLTLIPYLDRPDRTLPVPVESLLFTLDAEENFAWSPGAPPASDPFTGQTVAGTIGAAPVAGVRTALLEALNGQGVAVDTTVNVARLASPSSTDLEAPPRLRLLGGPAAA